MKYTHIGFDFKLLEQAIDKGGVSFCQDIVDIMVKKLGDNYKNLNTQMNKSDKSELQQVKEDIIEHFDKRADKIENVITNLNQ